MTTKKTIVTPAAGQVVITHSQVVRQSHNYNSAETSYGVSITVPDDDFAIRRGMLRAERLVEAPLNKKVDEQTKRLHGEGE